MSNEPRLSSREQFEQWVASEPHCESVARYPNDPAKYGWPDSYRSIEVSAMWEAWQAATIACQSADTPYQEMLAALRRQRLNIEHWLETGIPAGPEESKGIYEQIVAAVESAT